MSLTLPNDIVNDTTADASPVQQNYQIIEQYINSEVINRDGSVAMKAPLTLVGDPTQALHAATKSYVDAILPIGIMMPYGGTAAPGGGKWALCNGASVSQASYPELFAVIGSKFGTAAAGSFLLPDMAGRMPIGIDSSDGTCNVVGEEGGTTTPPLKTHTHGIDHNHGTKTTAPASVSHTHTINHDHGSVNTGNEIQGHTHGLNTVENSTPGATGQYMIGSSQGTAKVQFTATESATHQHSVNLPSYTGVSGGHSVNHTHTVDLDAFVGTTSAPKETADTKYRPPYLTVSYIIRMK